MVKPGAYVAWLKDLDRDDVHIVGGKAANMGEMIQTDFPVPAGFAITTTAYTEFLQANNLEKKIAHLVGTINFNDPNSVLQVSQTIKKLVNTSPIPNDLTKQIFKFYEQLDPKTHDPLVAIRSSLIHNASRASESFLNVKGDAALVAKIREIWSQLFDVPTILSYQQNTTNQLNGKIGLVVQRMVQSEASGVLFTIDPVTNNKDRVIINAILGLGEYLEEGQTLPDLYEVDKKRLEIVNKHIVTQETMLVKARTENKVISVPKKSTRAQKISDQDIVKLAELAKKLEKQYFFPQDCEWAKEDGKLYLVETKQITIIGKQESPKKSLFDVPVKTLLLGEPIRQGIGIGPVRILKSAKDTKHIVRGDILVISNMTTDYIPVLRKGAALIVESSMRNAQSTQLFRELDLPVVIGVPRARKVLADGLVVSVNGKTGEIVKGHINRKDTIQMESVIVPTKTKIFATIESTKDAEKISNYNSDGIGVLQAECFINEFGVHPKKILHERKGDQFVQSMSDSVTQICRSVYPNPVFYRISDLKSNEYRKLAGGREFELQELNPLLGYHGTFRHIHDQKVLELELKVIRHVREKEGLNNLNLMVPFVRNTRELEQIQQLIAQNGLRSNSTFKVYLSCSTPENVISLETYIRTDIDGVSVDLNVLNTLLTGMDLANEELFPAVDETNPSLLWALEKVIRDCKTKGIPAVIYGSGLSQNSELVEHVVAWGVTALSVPTDVIDLTREFVYKAERREKR